MLKQACVWLPLAVSCCRIERTTAHAIGYVSFSIEEETLNLHPRDLYLLM